MSAQLTITRELLREWDACWSDEEIAERVPSGGVRILQVLDAEDVDILDLIWVGLHAMTEREARLLACDWAERACAAAEWTAPRSLGAIAVARRYAVGEATEMELAAAGDAAWDAWTAWAAALTAASAAASDAALTAARAAAQAALATARAASAAALGAARAAAGSAERTRQLAEIRAVFERLEAEA